MVKTDDMIMDFIDGKLDSGIGNVYMSSNDSGENVIIQVFKDYLQLITLQTNGWLRINCYYKDGTRTETFSK